MARFGLGAMLEINVELSEFPDFIKNYLVLLYYTPSSLFLQF